MEYVAHITNRFVHLSFFSDHVAHIRVCFDDDHEPYPSYSLCPGTVCDAPYTVTEDAAHEQTCLATGSLCVAISRMDGSITATDPQGRVLHRDLRGRAYVTDTAGCRQHYFEVGGYRHIYGLGEKAGALNRFGHRYVLDMRDAIGYDAETTDPLYQQIPFIIRYDEGADQFCGLFYDAPYRGAMDLGCERSGYWPSYCKVTLESDEFDYYLIAGDSMGEVIRRYTDLTGKTAFPPLPSLGHMASTMYLTELPEKCDAAIEDYLQQMWCHGLGCDGYHLSSGYTAQDQKRCVFTWNRERFPDPDAFVSGLVKRGFLLSPNVKPALLTVHPLYDAFRKADAFLTDRRTGGPYLVRYWGGQASCVDMLSEAGRTMWILQLRRSLLSKGVNALWNDNNEYELDDVNAVTAGDARPASQLRPAFSNAMAQAAEDAFAQEAPELRPYVLSRSGFAGIQRFAQTWTGDNTTSWKTLRYNVPMMLGMSVSGVANQGCDIGGFAGPAPDAELFVRWVQNGIFQPRFCLHSCNDDNTLTLPWGYDAYNQLIRDAFRLRYRMIPLLYALMRNASETGEPIIRPLVYQFKDPDVLDEGFHFMLGDALLVASVLEPGQKKEEVYLPAGYEWLDWDTHQRYAGGQRISVDTPLSKIPLFYRSGAVIPLFSAPPLQLTPDAFRKIHLLIESSRNGECLIYQDDGISNGYLRGDYRKTFIRMTAGEDRVTLAFTHEGAYADHIETYELEIDGRFVAPLAIRLDGERIDSCLCAEEERQTTSENAWYFSLTERRVHLHVRNPARDFVLSLDYAIHDLIGM